MAPRQEELSSISTLNTLMPCIPSSWPMLAICSTSSAFIGLIFFIVGLIGVANESVSSRARDWIFLCFGLAMLTVGFSLLLLCRIRINMARDRRTQPRHRRRRRRDITSPVGRHDPLSIWATELNDSNFFTPQPPPDYYEALHCSPSIDPQRRVTVAVTGPPPYTPSEEVTRQSRSTLI